jgi:ADP-ribose pyrophosphatase YjhB (NUDIX family)
MTRFFDVINLQDEDIRTMKKKREYCSYCGKPIVNREQDGKMREYCPQCNAFYYENPLPVASTIVVNEDREVLLVRRKKDPYNGMWCLPIGFAESGEEVHEAALRELQEEAGITGKIIRLIDVDTVDNYFYGSLAIVTYEVERTGGEVRPGDDAVEARYFPIDEMPELAWASNEKAIRLYIENNRDTWAMVDSFRRLYPDIGTVPTFVQEKDEQKRLLSNVLIRMIGSDNEEITQAWSSETLIKVPQLKEFFSQIIGVHRRILRMLQNNLQGPVQSNDVVEFEELGRNLKKDGVPLPDLLIALALSRKSIWIHVIRKKILASPLEIYATLELNNRIIFMYDRVIYSIARGYSQ